MINLQRMVVHAFWRVSVKLVPRSERPVLELIVQESRFESSEFGVQGFQLSGMGQQNS